VYDLRFTGAEIRAFLSQVHRQDLPQPAIEKLAQITEGWSAGFS
jgi:ATP/maltotriose-dependent transcriptional regulator MalT